VKRDGRAGRVVHFVFKPSRGKEKKRGGGGVRGGRKKGAGVFSQTKHTLFVTATAHQIDGGRKNSGEGRTIGSYRVE